MSPTSSLDTSSRRFLSRCLSHTLLEGWLTARDVVQEFPPEVMMEALESASELRSRILVEAAGVHLRIAPKKSTSAAAEDLRIALEEGVVSPDSLLAIFTPDEQVRHLDTLAVWALVTRDEFWRRDEPRARARMLETLEIALDEKLLDLAGLVKAVGAERLALDLPKEVLERALALAITRGLEGAPLDPKTLLGSVPLAEWVDHVPLVHLWEEVILGVVAPGADLGSGGPPRAGGSGDVPKAPSGKDRTHTKRAAAAPPAQVEVAAKPEDRSPEELQARSRAVENLKKIDRLPRDVDQLATPLLLAIDGMYAEMASTDDDEARVECIRDAFPNPAMLKEGLFSLASTLDPRLDRESLEQREASVDSLIQLVLFEERRRRSRSLSPSSPPPAVREGSVPPPPTSIATRLGGGSPPPPPPLPGAARASAPPPPLPPQARKA